MMKVAFLVIMVILGLVFGSFACCQMWRIYYKNNKKKELGKWSVCLECGHKLRWWENIPVISWLILRGKCSKCGKKIGWVEILSEIGLGVVFFTTGWYFYDKIDIAYGINGFSFETIMVILKMVVLLITITLMWILLLYDIKWQEMPVGILIAVNVFAVVFLGLRIVGGERVDFLGVIEAVGILAGLYYLLYFFSKEKFVGGGDWILCLAIAIILGNWFLALVVLFLSNILASVFGIGAMIFLKKGRKSQIAFGPFLVIAFIITFVLQDLILKLMIIV